MAEAVAVVIRLVHQLIAGDFGLVRPDGFRLLVFEIVERLLDRRIHHRAGVFHHLDVVAGLVCAKQFLLLQAGDGLEIFLAAVEPVHLHPAYRVQRRQALGRLGDHERRVVHAVETGAEVFADEELLVVAGVDVAADVDVAGDVRIPAAERAATTAQAAGALTPAGNR